jgi:uncharacterized protein YbjT (DUF2867 family)
MLLITGVTGTLNEAADGIDRTLMISSSRGDMVSTQCSFIDAAKASGVRHVIEPGGKESGTAFGPADFGASADT